MSYISKGDLIDVFLKIKTKGVRFLFSKFKLIPKDRIASKWDNYESKSDFWVIPEITDKWNEIISGNSRVIYEDYVYEKYLKGKTGLKLLSVGCGEGFHDRNFAKYDCFESILGLDYSPESIRIAQENAKEGNLNINYICGDFYQKDFNEKYDVILFSSSLHHFDKIDFFLKNTIKPLLKDDGILVVFEFVGPNRLQWRENQLNKANELLRQIPNRYKVFYDGQTIKKKVYKPGYLRMLMVDPSEAIDSEAIVPALKKHFKIIEEKNLGWNILHILLKGIAHNFLNEEEETKKLINELIEYEYEFVHEVKSSDAIFGVYSL
jgi:2-polyprenyl-3-methyl-5-hydroxy-6-metoxy-1,4-benzoquinol methylase